MKDKVIDVRKKQNMAEHIEDAYNRPLSYINEWITDNNPNNIFISIAEAAIEVWRQGRFCRPAGIELLQK